MSQQALDLRRSMKIIRRHRRVVGIAALLGLLAGGALAVLYPPRLTAQALVVLPQSASRTIGTQVVIAGSNPVLAKALPAIQPPMSMTTLRSRIQVKSLTSNIISISGQGTTAAEAEATTNTVARSYIDYLGSANALGGRLQARLLETATNAMGRSPAIRVAIAGVLGALAGALIGGIVALAIGRGERRLRERDEIADAIGVPVLASVPVRHPSDAAAWAQLLEEYQPGAVNAWSLRKALQYLGLSDVEGGNATSVVLLSLSSDPGALALGPQLAVYAASRGIPTAFVMGPQQNANVTATLRAACAVPPPAKARWSGRLWVSVSDHGSDNRPSNALLTIVVAVVDPQAPRVADKMRTTTTLLGVSAGAASAEQLARVAASAADDGRHIAGILVADPDPADHTTGRFPQLARSAQRRSPARLTGTTTETR
jgi:capsular polysaccharide biosynthesis protein